MTLDFSKNVRQAQAWPLEFNNSFFGGEGWAHNAGGLQLEIPDPDVSFGLSCRETDRGHWGATASDGKD